MAKNETLAQEAQRLTRELVTAADPGSVADRLQAVVDAMAAEERLAEVRSERAALDAEEAELAATVERVRPRGRKARA